MQAKRTEEPVEEVVPVGQELHTEAPEAAYLLIGHIVHEDCPLVAVYWPASQEVQVCCPEAEKVPVGQGWHKELGSQRKEPAVQEVQAEASAARSVPTGQGVHTPEAGALEVLTGQSVQGPVAPPETVFAGQLLHEVALVALFHVPGGHTMQEGASEVSLYVPAVHPIHAPVSGSDIVPCGQAPGFVTVTFSDELRHPSEISTK